MPDEPTLDPLFTIALPGGAVARVPLSLLRQHTDASARACHGAGSRSPKRDVTAHSLEVDATTGVSDWHTEWELGECDYTDELGFTQTIIAWHKHPLGTEYAELFEG